ncbi:conjugal transfer pilus assembly protein TraB [Gammaproteobacteria bacterium]
MNLKENVKNMKENINELARKSQTKTALLVLGFIAILIFIGWMFMHSKKEQPIKKDEHPKQVVRLSGTADSQFNQESSQKALEEQQREIKELHDQLAALDNQIGILQKTLDDKDENNSNQGESTIQELQTKIAELEDSINKRAVNRIYSPSSDGMRSIGEARGITTTNFSYQNDSQSFVADTKSSGNELNISEKIKTVKNYVPPGTFAKAVFLSGADTNAGVHGQTDTIPIIMRILDNGTLPNGEHSSLKGCFVTAAAYGDASSERGQIRLQRLSCVKKSTGLILDIPVEGTINDMGGSDGIRGHVVMRNNKLIWNAGVSGMLSGIGQAMQQSATTQSTTPLGVTSAIQPSKIFQYGAFGGANSALGKLADYYIKLADMYHPIVQIHAGSQVNVVFLKGFSLFSPIENQGITSSPAVDKTKTDYSHQDAITQNLARPESAKDLQMGQTVDSAGSNGTNENNYGDLQ